MFCLKAYLGCLFTEILIMSFPPVMNSVVIGEEGLGSLWENLG